YVSVFVEPFSPAAHGREATVATGATQTLTRRLGDAWITVIGDVPTVTLKAFALGLERRR
ncbi:MAG TPA: MucB/RseB C-terminal domain-containing protein, partial [Methylibium sp.]|nr:MucB/RseB C-terminal domain-containing protein [Methylibium sp.]